MRAVLSGGVITAIGRKREPLHLVEIFLPISDKDGLLFKKELFGGCQKEMTDRFGGATLFGRAPAHGTSTDEGKATHDDIVVLEVIVQTLDRKWWSDYRRQLEQRFDQDEILIRAIEIVKL